MRNDRFLEISGLIKEYPNPFGEPLRVIDGFDLLVPQGQLVSIIGHSGCGKSTVLTMIAGLNDITHGGIVVAGREIEGPGPDRAVVFQAPCLLPWMHALDNVLLGVRSVYPHATRRERFQIAEYALHTVGLGESMHKFPRELSGGMQQRVGIARAIALQPKVLLLDEPFGRLDSLTRMELQDVILGILDRQRITTLLITHDVDEAVYMSDRIVMMTNGPRAKVGEILEIDFPRPRDRGLIMADSNFYRYRERLLRFLDDCGHEKAARKQTRPTAHAGV
ncbi:nitrate ABC transporter ATP-binding protein [Opitutales bacterium ASA1]|uniref:ABC transporter ATP-binding protein n=1 Tax=Congregicoccus parvus TaxID=3081749 RepID=UPI002B31958A|nr:nitrate ABC transporter ATP-binding protein [Opitutales bacterium ASA1]